jgi:hypothetical protein
LILQHVSVGLDQYFALSPAKLDRNGITSSGTHLGMAAITRNTTSEISGTQTFCSKCSIVSIGGIDWITIPRIAAQLRPSSTKKLEARMHGHNLLSLHRFSTVSQYYRQK